MNPISYAIVAFAVVGGVAWLAGSILLRRWAAVPQERFETTTAEVLPKSILRWDDRARARWQRILERLGRVVGPRDRAKALQVRQRLAWAGYHDPRAFRYFIGAKGASAILCGYSYVLVGLYTQRALPYLLPVSAAFVILGFFLPDLWLDFFRIKPRQRQILHALPDTLDLLMVCVEAGMGFDAAVGRVTERTEVQRSPLHQEMLRMHLEIRVGRPREEALHAFAENTGVEDVKSIVAAFIQTERLGTSLGRTLRVHAESARVKRRRRAEERAQMAPLKMIFPTVIFLMPVFFLITLAPALLRLVAAMKAIQ